jgi:hypothetical protein
MDSKRILVALAVSLLPQHLLAQIDVIDQQGQIKIEPTYQGQNVSALTGANFDLLVIAGNLGGHLSTSSPNLQGSLYVGSYSPYIVSNGGTMASTSITVTANTLSQWNPELSGVMGLVQGIIRVNGNLPPAGQYSVLASYANKNLDGTGFFRFLLPAGSHTASVTGPNGQIHTFTINVTANQETNLGSINTVDAQGNMKIEPLYQGQTLASLAGVSFDILAMTGAGPGEHLSPGTPSQTWAVQVGTYNPYVISNGGVVASGTVTVPANGLVEFKPELSSTMGLVNGVIRVNGNLPPPGQYSISASFANKLLDATGTFRMLLPAGSHSATVTGPNGQIHSFTFNVTANLDTNLGTIQTVDQTGDIKIEPLYKGQLVSSLTGAVFDLLAISGAGPGGHLSTSTPSMTWKVQAKTINPYIISNGGSVANGTVTVPANGLVSFRPELSTKMGLVRGVIRVNGNPPPPGQYSVYASYANKSLDGTGTFRMLLPAGNHTGIVNGPLGTLLSFPITVIAGQEIDLGTPGALNFVSSIALRSGTQASRTWTVRLRNVASYSYLNVTGKLILAQSAGTPSCTPTITSSNPVSFGDFAPNASIDKTFTINFTGCPTANPNAARFNAKIQVTSGTSTATFNIESFSIM